MASYYPFTHDESNYNITTFYAKTDATWEQMSTYLESTLGDNGKDKHWKWCGFGKIGEKFQVVAVRRPCSKYICKCAEESDDE